MTELLLRLFIKDYQNTQSDKVRSAVGSMAGFVGIGCNALLFALKLIAGTLAGSVSITADALNKRKRPQVAERNVKRCECRKHDLRTILQNIVNLVAHFHACFLLIIL